MSTATKNLRKARKIRHQMSHRFELIESGEMLIEDAIRDPDSVLGRVRITDLLRRAPHLGPKGAENVCRRAKVWPITKVGNLTTNERDRLVRSLPPRARSSD